MGESLRATGTHFKSTSRCRRAPLGLLVRLIQGYRKCGLCGSLVWRWMYESEIKESLKLHRMPGLSQVELRRGNGASQALEYTWHNLPRNGGRGLMMVCPRCRRPRRFLYGWQNEGECVRRSLWQCRECAGLRYRSKGTYIPREWRCWGGYPRTPPWNPEIVI